MKNFLAIDIGGTKTRILIFSKCGILAERESVGVGLAVESDADLPIYREALSEIAREYEISAACINLGGRNAQQIRRVTESVLRDVPILVVRESEGDAALAFGSLVGAKLVLLAGTGTIACATSDKGKCIFGGWGMNIGDGGSGYDIGLCAIRETLLALDGTDALTPLQRDISGLDAPILPTEDAKEICSLRDAVRARLRHTDRRAVAALVKTVAAHAEKGEADALAILAEAGRRMGALVIGGIKKMGLSAESTVAVTGGLVNVLPYFKQEFENTVKKETGVSRFVYEKDGLMRGIMMLAKELEK